MHVAQLIQRGSIILGGGLAIPDQSPGVDLGDAEAAKIVVPQLELRLRVSRSGRLAKRIELLLRRQRHRLRRRLYLCLPRRLSKSLGSDSWTKRQQSCCRGPGPKISPKTHGGPHSKHLGEITGKDVTATGLSSRCNSHPGPFPGQASHRTPRPSCRLAGGSSYHNRLLVLKGWNVLNGYIRRWPSQYERIGVFRMGI